MSEDCHTSKAVLSKSSKSSPDDRKLKNRSEYNETVAENSKEESGGLSPLPATIK